MPLEKKTIKIIAIVVAALIVVVVVLGLLLGLLLRSSDNIELQVWPRGADGSAQPLISYKRSDNTSVQSWVQRIENFLGPYKNHHINRIVCNYMTILQENQVCDVPVENLHPCLAVNQYNYNNATPCIFLKLDKISDWTPNPYNMTVDLPQNMPENLKGVIKANLGKPEANEVWVSCAGVEEADNKHIGPVKYIPRRGFLAYYFPSKNKDNYLSPLVAVIFEKPQHNVLINVECKAWAKNINTCKDCEPTVSARFQLMIN